MKCPHCDKITRKKWYYCPYCSEQLKIKRKYTIKKEDEIICINCGLSRARHFGLREKLSACNNFKKIRIEKNG